MKKTKVIIPALGLLVLSTAASVTGTVAWFSSNQIVTANGMQVKAKAQAGLVIANTAVTTASSYSASAASVKATVAELFPASTADLATWVTSTSTNPNNANTQQAYSTAAAWVDNNTAAHYVVHDFYIRSSATELTVGSLDVNSVAVIATSQTEQDDGFDNLSKSLRVGIKFDGSANHYIYAPVNGYTASYTVQSTTGAYVANDRTTVTPLSGSTVSHDNDTHVTTIPANTAVGLHAFVYIWFEGEDAACISNNIIANLESLTVSVEFSYTAAQQNNG